jgi:hypothetical protein
VIEKLKTGNGFQVFQRYLNYGLAFLETTFSFAGKHFSFVRHLHIDAGESEFYLNKEDSIFAN